MYKRGQHVQSRKPATNTGHHAQNIDGSHRQSGLFAGEPAKANAHRMGKVLKSHAPQLVGAMDAPPGYPTEGSRQAQFEALMQHIRAVYAQYGR